MSTEPAGDHRAPSLARVLLRALVAALAIELVGGALAVALLGAVWHLGPWPGAEAATRLALTFLGAGLGAAVALGATEVLASRGRPVGAVIAGLALTPLVHLGGFWARLLHTQGQPRAALQALLDVLGTWLALDLAFLATGALALHAPLLVARARGWASARASAAMAVGALAWLPTALAWPWLAMEPGIAQHEQTSPSFAWWLARDALAQRPAIRAGAGTTMWIDDPRDPQALVLMLVIARVALAPAALALADRVARRLVGAAGMSLETVQEAVPAPAARRTEAALLGLIALLVGSGAVPLAITRSRASRGERELEALHARARGPLAPAEQYDLGHALAQRGEVSAGLALLERAALRGHAGAAYSRAVHREHGYYGVPVDPDAAIGEYLRALALGRADRTNTIDRLAREHPTLPRARAWHLAHAHALRRQADAGSTRAMIELSDRLDVLGEPTEATTWLERAAAAGDAGAMVELGWRLTHAMGVARDLEAAVSWYRLAASRGGFQGAAAECRLGAMFEEGLGLPRDDHEAAASYRRALARRPSFVEARDRLERLLIRRPDLR